MSYMSEADWQAYRDVLNTWQEDAFQEDIIWRRLVTRTNAHGEDSNDRYSDTTLKGLLQYNYFRSWPMTQPTDTGEIDKESVLLYLNLKHLDDLTLLDAKKQFKFSPGFDRFVLRGRIYKAMGDSHIAQAKDQPVFIFIILKREETSTGDPVYDNE